MKSKMEISISPPQTDNRSKQKKIGNIEFPAKLTDLQKLAKALDYKISVFEYQTTTSLKTRKQKVSVFHNEKPIPRKNYIYLLVAKQEIEESINYHIMNIKNFNRLMYTGITNNKLYYCKNCLNYFYSEQKLISHTPNYYQKEQESNDEFPKIGTFVQFKNIKIDNSILS